MSCGSFGSAPVRGSQVLNFMSSRSSNGATAGHTNPVLQVRQLCAEMGEEVEVRGYDRFTPLAVEEGGLRGGYRRVQPGDCVVAFSRKSIFAIKRVRRHLADVSCQRWFSLVSQAESGCCHFGPYTLATCTAANGAAVRKLLPSQPPHAVSCEYIITVLDVLSDILHAGACR